MPVETFKDENKANRLSSLNLENWIAAVAPTLKTYWVDYLFSLSANQPPPNFENWLELLHSAAKTPEQIPFLLGKVIKNPGRTPEEPLAWQLLTDLLALTFEAAHSEAAKLTAADWQGLLELQNRILKANAQLASKPGQPDVSRLKRQALYLQIITTLNRKMLETPLEALLAEIVETIGHHLEYDYVNLFVFNASKKNLVLQQANWKGKTLKPESAIELNLGQGLVGQAAAKKQAILLKNTLQNPDFVPHPDLPQVKSQLSTPILVEGNLLGVLDIQNDAPDSFLGEDLAILQALADHLGILIDNMRLQKVHHRSLREQALIYESIVALGSDTDMSTVLRQMSQKITEIVDAGACVICRLDEKTGVTTALAEYVLRRPGNPSHTWRKLNTPVRIVKDPLSQQVLKAARPIVSRASARGKELVWQAPTGNMGGKSRWNMVLALPLEIKSKVIGLVEIYDKNPNRAFSPEDVQICRTLATQTALAMEQARLLNETIQRLAEVSVLYTLAQKLSSSLDLDDILDTIVTLIRQAVGCRACCIFLLDGTGEMLEIKAASGLKPQWREAARLRLGEGAAGRAAAEGRSIYLPDTSQTPNFIFFDQEVRSLMVVPLRAQGKIIGTINVDDNQPNAFGPAQERLLTITAMQIGITIENARLFASMSAEQQQMQAIMQYMADGLMLVDSHGTIMTCNSTLAVMLGMHEGQIIGQNIHSPNLSANLANVTASTTYRARTGVLAKEVTIDVPRPRTLQVFSTVVVDKYKNPVGEVRVVHDVTRERELDQLKDDFFSTISHELRTPLFSIQGFAQLMLEEKNLDSETQHEFLSTIQRQAIQLSQMVNNLLDLSKFDEGKLVFEKKPVSMANLINQTVLKLQGFAHQRKVRVTTQLPPSLPMIQGDAQRLEQVLTNLIGNAIKFSETEEKVTITASISATELQVQVKDNGVGIPSEALERIFSRYYQVDDKSERSAMGTGLGLNIAKKVVEGHGGRIWAESAAGQGSTFCFTLPVNG
jgi:two-component system, NtrC family, sensor histidine kinase KinB